MKLFTLIPRRIDTSTNFLRLTCSLLLLVHFVSQFGRASGDKPKPLCLYKWDECLADSQKTSSECETDLQQYRCPRPPAMYLDQPSAKTGGYGQNGQGETDAPADQYEAQPQAASYPPQEAPYEAQPAYSQNNDGQYEGGGSRASSTTTQVDASDPEHVKYGQETVNAGVIDQIRVKDKKVHQQEQIFIKEDIISIEEDGTPAVGNPTNGTNQAAGGKGPSSNQRKPKKKKGAAAGGSTNPNPPAGGQLARSYVKPFQSRFLKSTPFLGF